MFEVLELETNGQPGGYIVYLRGMDETDEHDDEDWCGLVHDVESLPVFATVDEAVNAARTVPRHGYEWNGVTVYDGASVYTVR